MSHRFFTVGNNLDYAVERSVTKRNQESNETRLAISGSAEVGKKGRRDGAVPYNRHLLKGAIKIM